MVTLKGLTLHEALQQVHASTQIHQVLQALQQFDGPELIFNYTQAWEAECVPDGNLTNECALAAFQSEVLPLWQDDAAQGQNATQQVCAAHCVSCA